MTKRNLIISLLYGNNQSIQTRYYLATSFLTMVLFMPVYAPNWSNCKLFPMITLAKKYTLDVLFVNSVHRDRVLIRSSWDFSTVSVY